MEMGEQYRYNEYKDQDDKCVDSETKETGLVTNEAASTEAFTEN